MLRHLLKLAWSRKRTHALVVLELFAAFLVLFALTGVGSYLADNVRRPIGFAVTDVWRVAIDVGRASDDDWDTAQGENLARVLDVVRNLPWVEAAAGSLAAPYSFASSNRIYGWTDGREIETEVQEVTDDFARVMGLSLVEGRWFGREDDGGEGIVPVVVDRRLARDLYGDESPLGRPANQLDPGEPEQRIVGVVAVFRRGGELSGDGNDLFVRRRLDDPDSRPPSNLVVRVAPGTGVEREEELVRALAAAAPAWSFEVTPLSESRRSYFRMRLAPLAAGALVAAFLLLMVGLGLTGVVWQNVARRTREIGLRRAAGASGGDIHRQLLGELLVLAGLGLGLGILVVLQLPIVGLLSFLPWRVVLVAAATAAAVLVALTLAAGWYPTWLARRVPPAVALRAE